MERAFNRDGHGVRHGHDHGGHYRDVGPDIDAPLAGLTILCHDPPR